MLAFFITKPLLEENRTIRVHDRKIKKAEAKKNYKCADQATGENTKTKNRYDYLAEVCLLFV